MTLLALAFSLAIAALGALGLASPARLLGVLQRFRSRGGLYTAAAIRLAMGAVFVLAAPDSGAPALIQGLGIFVILAGLVTPLFGVERFTRLLDWWFTQDAAIVRVWSLFVIAFGLLVANAFLP